jgi:hypothetical protein
MPAFGDEGTDGCTPVTKVRESQERAAPAGNIASGTSSGTTGRPEWRDMSKPGSHFGAEGAAILDTWLPPTCKKGSVQGRDKGCRV